MKNSFLLFILVSFWGCQTNSTSDATLLTPQEFAAQMKSDGNIILLDVRTQDEMQNGFLDGARNLDFSSPDFETSLDKLDHSRKYFVYCAVGKRSGKAAVMMKSKGFQDVTALEGGLNAWVAAGLSVQKP